MRDDTHTWESEIYPITIIEDRYTGVYSRGIYTAWNCDPEDIPSDISAGDVTCMMYWENDTEHRKYVGRGSTPDEALKDLKRRVGEIWMFQEELILESYRTKKDDKHEKEI